MGEQHLPQLIIFDDDEDLLFICKYYFEGKGWRVNTFNNCENIISKLSAITPGVIIMDNWIPDTGGIIATQTLKKDERLKNIPVIYFSANNEIEVLAAKAGADNHIQKPFQLDELEAIMLAAIKNAKCI